MLTLERFCYSPCGTFGRLTLPEFMAWTVERPWLNNSPRESCIPEGEYALEEATFFRGGYKTYEIIGVPGRTLIKFHKANTKNDLLGCVGLGRRLGVVDMEWGVIESAPAFAEFMAAMNREKPDKVIVTHRSGEGVLA